MEIKIFSGSSHPEFAKRICDHLKIKVGQSKSIVFSNDNRFITIEESVRGQDVFVVQTSCEPVDAHLMELLMHIRALRDASAGRVTAVIPYLPYVRSDKKDQPRICITARLVADLIEAAGADRVLTMDLHSPQIQGFFSIPCDQLLAAPTIVKYLKKNWKMEDYVLVAGDAGASKMLKTYSDALDLPVAIMDKRRDKNDEKPTIKGVIGEVKGKKALLIDDETSSGQTLIRDAKFLLQKAKVKSVDACIVHAVLGGEAVKDLNASPIKRFIITNTIAVKNKKIKNREIVDVSRVFAECIRRIHANESVKSLNDI